MTPKICNYYVTLHCNDTCEFCPVWQDPEYQKIRESDDQEVLKSIKRLGVRELNITGGEPLLRDDLPQILEQAKKLGFFVRLTTNGILYPARAEALKGLVDQLFFSLDHPVAEEHDRSRGVECFHEVIKAIKLARQLGQKPIIHFTMTRDSVRFLPEMIDLTERLGVMLYPLPVYGFHGTQGFEPATLAHIRYYFKSKSVLLNLAALEFVKAGGNRVILPRCRANETTITLLPDGERVAPCFFNQAGQQGREDICSSCMRWPYMLPSFSSGLDKYFWLDLCSKMVSRRKGVKL